MKTTYYLRTLLTAIICLLTGFAAQAQDLKTFSGSVEQYPTTNFATSPINFSLSEVAAELGTDAATLGATLSEWLGKSKGTTDPNYLFLVKDGEKSDKYSTNLTGGFWITTEGAAAAYSDGTWYEDFFVSVEGDSLAFNVGQKPNALNGGDVAKATFVLEFNEKAVQFEITLTIKAKPEDLVIPEPATLKEDELNVVGEVEVTVEQYPRTGYDSDAVTIEIPDLAEKLGISVPILIQESLGDLLYCTAFDLDNVGKKDSVSNQSTAGAPGFWVTDIRVDGQATGECSANAYSQGDMFFVESFAFNADTNVLSFVLGQYPGNLKGDEHFFVNLYIIYGDKAYRVRVIFNVLVVPQGNGLADYTKVGESTVVVEQEPTDDYSTKVVVPDLETIAQALGCEVADIRMKAIDLDNNFASSTANNGGFWFNEEGNVCSWGAQAVMFIEPTNAPDGDTNLPDLTSFNVGQYPNVFNVGDEHTAFIHFFNGPEGDKYYSLGVTIKAIEPQKVEGDFENVRGISFTIQTLVSADAYGIDETWSIDLSVLENIIGTVDPKLYGLATDENAETTGSIYSDKYSCDPKPGFWLDAEGRVSTWSSSSPVGICYAGGTFQFFQYPGANNVGDVFKTQLFLVNTENNKMITFNISVAFVESIEKAEVVGEEDITIPVSAEGIDSEIDLSKAAEALGVSVADLTSDDNTYLRGLCDTGVYGEGKTCFDGLAFDQNGYYDIMSGVVFFTIDPESFVLNAFTEGVDVTEDFMMPVKFCFQIDNKQYIFNAKFVSEAIYAGISNVNAERGNAQVYDLSGRRVGKPVRGLYIKDGKKFIVK